jgi:hypothetical protein
MADFSESDYGEMDYGLALYSYSPITLFATSAVIQLDTNAVLTSYAFRTFGAVVQVVLWAAPPGLVVDYVFESTVRVTFDVDSNEHIGPFWDPWNPIYPEEDPWIPVSPSGTWQAVVPKKRGPWIPIGPDRRPNG